ncbi:MAG: hypothetical protein ACQETL_18515 [Bacteroidota bacterium]
MKIFSKLFKKSGSKENKKELTAPQEIQQDLASIGITTDLNDIKVEFKRLWNTINFNQVFPEALSYSNSAEMEFDGSNYNVDVSMHISDIKSIMTLAAYWATASEISKMKGENKYSLKKGDRIAICDFYGLIDNLHPIYSIFPRLLKIKVS